MIITTANKWGSSYGIRITKSILEQFPIQDKEKLEVYVENDKLIFTRAKESIRHKKLEDLLIERGWQGETFENEPIEDYDFIGKEVPL